MDGAGADTVHARHVRNAAMVKDDALLLQFLKKGLIVLLTATADMKARLGMPRPDFTGSL